MKVPIIRLWSRRLNRRLQRQLKDVPDMQLTVLQHLMRSARHTEFGQKHHFSDVHTPEDLRQAIPLSTYADHAPYIQKIADGASDVLWHGRPLYFATSTGTTAGKKYLPITREMLEAQFEASVMNMSNFTYRLGLHDVHKGKWVLFADPPIFHKFGTIKSGALSSILTAEKPKWVNRMSFPSRKVDLIPEYEDKITATARETIGQDIRGIVAMPPLLLLYLRKVEEISGKPINRVFPNLRIVSTAGMSFDPYRELVQSIVNQPVTFLQAYPASEGYFAFQTDVADTSMVLLPHSGMFYEFVPVSEMEKPNPRRLWIQEVEVGVPYVIHIHTCGGLWGYNMGDVVEFTQLNPPKLRVLGRVGQSLNAFGEHFTQVEVETAVTKVVQETGFRITDFTLTPVMVTENGLPRHEWFVEFENGADVRQFSQKLDEILCKQNMCYDDLIRGKALNTLTINPLQRGTFKKLMMETGRAGTQYKTRRFIQTDEAEVLRKISASIPIE
jgi:hypothetical protein